MSTETTAPDLKRTPVESPLNMKELATLLIKHYEIRQGSFELMVEYQLGTGAVGPDSEHLLPGLMIGIAKVGLVPTTSANALTVDAADVNPAPKTRKRF